MEEVRSMVEELYLKFGHNEVVVAASQILDEYIVEEQKKKELKN